MSETKIRSNIGGTYGIQLPQIHPGDEEDSHHPDPQHAPSSSSACWQTSCATTAIKCEMLGNCGSAVAQLGLKYVHNDTCYPALLVIGQFLDALNSGKYDLRPHGPDHHPDGRRLPCLQLHPPAAQGAGQGGLSAMCPVVSLNFSGLEKDTRLPDDPAAGPPGHRQRVLRRSAAAPCATRSRPMRTRRALPISW